MVRKTRKRISYVLPLANSAGGHRLGVNGLAVDPYNSFLYSGGRDGVICAWDLNLPLSPFDDQPLHSSLNSSPDRSPDNAPPTTFRQQVQAHTHWVNDIVLAHNNEALVSASSDITVKLWRPGAQDAVPPQTIGLHGDYVKCLAYPRHQATWVASGGLDRKICLWDLSGAGQILHFDVGEEENTAKGSVYAMGVTSTLLASGGPESIVRVWDLRTATPVMKLVGHTDNIRDVLISQDGDTVLSASSDQTVKVWSMSAGRCMYTLTMHNDSVWSLYSDHPRLSIFYSSDRSGLVAKTDTRRSAEIDEGLSVAVCQEHEGVAKVIAAGDYIWTATSSSSINRWKDVDTEAEVQVPRSYSFNRASMASTSRSRMSPPPNSLSPIRDDAETEKGEEIPQSCILRLSNAAPFHVFRHRDTDAGTLHSAASIRKPSEALEAFDHSTGFVAPFRSMPDLTIEGHHGLIKHVMLNDRRRVLTVDTAAEVMLWDLLKCVPIQSFGKRHLDDVVAEVNTAETVPYWCAVDTRTGSLTCVLEENNCFDAEMYADEIMMDEKIDFREDQRINLGRWVLRYLFSNLIDEEIRRDTEYRQELIDSNRPSTDRKGMPLRIQLPVSAMRSWDPTSPTSASTIRPINGWHNAVLPTPGLGIGLATPGIGLATPGIPPPLPGQAIPPMPNLGGLTAPAEDGSALTRAQTQPAGPRMSAERFGNDYFSGPFSGGQAAQGVNTNGAHVPAVTPGEAPSTPSLPDAAIPQSPAAEPTEKAEKGLFGSKKFRMNFNMKTLGRSKTADPASTALKPSSGTSEDGDSRSSKTEEQVIQDNFLGALQKIRLGYAEQLAILQKGDEKKQSRDSDTSLATHKLESGITPSLPSDTPVLKPPLQTVILIQEDRPDSGGVADLFEGTVGSLGEAGNADRIEFVAPTWLADCLLRNVIPQKEIVKISFVLEPWQGLLPNIASDGETATRLNANRMLRCRKILSYIAERVEPLPETPVPGAPKPEEYLELYCQDKLVPPTMTLATIRAHIWRGGGDVVLMYRANGRKSIRVPGASTTASMGASGGSMVASGPTPRKHMSGTGSATSSPLQQRPPSFNTSNARPASSAASASSTVSGAGGAATGMHSPVYTHAPGQLPAAIPRPGMAGRASTMGTAGEGHRRSGEKG